MKQITKDTLRERITRAAGSDIGKPVPTAVVTRERGAVRAIPFTTMMGDKGMATGIAAGFFNSAAPLQPVCTTEFYDN